MWRNASVIAAIILFYWYPTHWLGTATATVVTANDWPQQSEAAKDGEISNGSRYEPPLVQLPNKNSQVPLSPANQPQANNYHQLPPIKAQEVNRESQDVQSASNQLFSTSQSLQSNDRNATFGNISHTPALVGTFRRNSVGVVPQPIPSFRDPFFGNLIYLNTQPQISIKTPAIPISSRSVSVVNTYPAAYRQVSPGNARYSLINPWSNVREFSVPYSNNKGDSNIKSRIVGQTPDTGNVAPQNVPNIFKGERSAILPSPEQQHQKLLFYGGRGLLEHLKTEMLPITKQNPTNHLQTKPLPLGDGRNGFQPNAIQSKVTDNVEFFNTVGIPPPELPKFSFNAQQNQQNSKTVQMDSEYMSPLRLHIQNNPFSSSFLPTVNTEPFITRSQPSVPSSTPSVQLEKRPPNVELGVPVLQDTGNNKAVWQNYDLSKSQNQKFYVWRPNMFSNQVNSNLYDQVATGPLYAANRSSQTLNRSSSIPSTIQVDMNIMPPSNLTNNLPYTGAFSDSNLNPDELSTQNVRNPAVTQAVAGTPLIPKTNEQKDSRFTDIKNSKPVWQNYDSPDVQKLEAPQPAMLYSNHGSMKTTVNPKIQTPILTDKVRQPQPLAGNINPPSNSVASLLPAEDIMLKESIQQIPISSQIYGGRVLTSEVVRPVVDNGKLQNKIPLSQQRAAGITDSVIPNEPEIFPGVINSKDSSNVQSEPRRDINRTEILKPITVDGDNRKEPVFNRAPIFSIADYQPFDFTQPSQQWLSRYRIPYTPKINDFQYQPVFQFVLRDQNLPIVPTEVGRESSRNLKQVSQPYIPFDQQSKGSNALIYPTNVPQHSNVPQSEMIQSLDKLRASQYPMPEEWLRKYWKQGDARINLYINEQLPNPWNQKETPMMSSRYALGDEFETSYPRVSQYLFDTNTPASQPNKAYTVPHSVPTFHQQVTDAKVGIQTQSDKTKPQLANGKELIDDAGANVINIGIGDLTESADYLSPQPLNSPTENLTSALSFNTSNVTGYFINQNPPQSSHNGTHRTNQWEAEVDRGKHPSNEPTKDKINPGANIKYWSHPNTQSSYKSFQISLGQPEIMLPLNYVQPIISPTTDEYLDTKANAQIKLGTQKTTFPPIDSERKPTPEDEINVLVSGEGNINRQPEVRTNNYGMYKAYSEGITDEQQAPNILVSGQQPILKGDFGYESFVWPHDQGQRNQLEKIYRATPDVNVRKQSVPTGLTNSPKGLRYFNGSNTPTENPINAQGMRSYQYADLFVPEKPEEYFTKNWFTVSKQWQSNIPYAGHPNNEQYPNIQGSRNMYSSSQTQFPGVKNINPSSNTDSQQTFQTRLKSYIFYPNTNNQPLVGIPSKRSYNQESTSLPLPKHGSEYIVTNGSDVNQPLVSGVMYDTDQGQQSQSTAEEPVTIGNESSYVQPNLGENKNMVSGKLFANENVEGGVKDNPKLIDKTLHKDKQYRNERPYSVNTYDYKQGLPLQTTTGVQPEITQLPVETKDDRGGSAGGKNTSPYLLVNDESYFKSDDLNHTVDKKKPLKQPDDAELPITYSMNTIPGNESGSAVTKKPPGQYKVTVKFPSGYTEGEESELSIEPIYQQTGQNDIGLVGNRNMPHKIPGELAKETHGEANMEHFNGESPQEDMDTNQPRNLERYSIYDPHTGYILPETTPTIRKDLDSNVKMLIQDPKQQYSYSRLPKSKNNNINYNDDGQGQYIMNKENQSRSPILPVVPDASLKGDNIIDLLEPNKKVPSDVSPKSDIQSGQRDMDERVDVDTDLPSKTSKLDKTKFPEEKSLTEPSSSPLVSSLGNFHDKHGPFRMTTPEDLNSSRWVIQDSIDRYSNFRVPKLNNEYMNIGDGSEQYKASAYDGNPRGPSTVPLEGKPKVPSFSSPDGSAMSLLKPNKKLITDINPKSNIYSGQRDFHDETYQGTDLPMDSSRLNRNKTKLPAEESVKEASSSVIHSENLEMEMPGGINNLAKMDLTTIYPSNSEQYSINGPYQRYMIPNTINNQYKDAGGTVLRGPVGQCKVAEEFTSGDTKQNESPPQKEINLGNADDKNGPIEKEHDNNDQTHVQNEKDQQFESRLPTTKNENPNIDVGHEQYMIREYDENQRRSPTLPAEYHPLVPNASLQRERTMDSNRELPIAVSPKSNVYSAQRDLDKRADQNTNLPIEKHQTPSRVINKKTTFPTGETTSSMNEPSHSTIQQANPEVLTNPGDIGNSGQMGGSNQPSNSQQYSVHGPDRRYVVIPNNINNQYKDARGKILRGPTGQYKVAVEFTSGDTNQNESPSQKVVILRKINEKQGPFQMTTAEDLDNNGRMRDVDPEGRHSNSRLPIPKEENTKIGDGAKKNVIGAYDKNRRHSPPSSLEINAMVPEALGQDENATNILEPKEKLPSNDIPKSISRPRDLEEEEETDTILPTDSLSLNKNNNKLPAKIPHSSMNSSSSSIGEANLEAGLPEGINKSAMMELGPNQRSDSQRYSVYGPEGYVMPETIDNDRYKDTEVAKVRTPAGRYKVDREFINGNVNQKEPLSQKEINHGNIDDKHGPSLMTIRMNDDGNDQMLVQDPKPSNSRIQSSNLKMPGHIEESEQKMKFSPYHPTNSERFSILGPDQGNVAPKTINSGYKKPEGELLRGPAGQYIVANEFSRMEPIIKGLQNIGINIRNINDETIEPSRITIIKDLNNDGQIHFQNPKYQYSNSGNPMQMNKNTNNDGPEQNIIGAYDKNPKRSSTIPVERFLIVPKTSLQDDSAMDSLEPNNKLPTHLNLKSNMYSRPRDVDTETERGMILPLDSSGLNNKHQLEETKYEPLSKRTQSANLHLEIPKDVDKSVDMKLGASLPTNSKLYLIYAPDQADMMLKTINNENEEADDTTLRGPSGQYNVTVKFMNGDTNSNERPSQSAMNLGNVDDKYRPLRITMSEDLDGRGQMRFQYPKQQQSHSRSPSQNDKTRNVDDGTNQHMNEHDDNQTSPSAFPVETDRMVPSAVVESRFPSDVNPKSGQHDLDEETEQGTISPIDSATLNKGETKLPVLETKSTSKPPRSSSQPADLTLGTEPEEKSNSSKQIIHIVPQRTAVRSDVVNPLVKLLIPKNKYTGPLLQADVPNSDGTKQYTIINQLNDDKRIPAKLSTARHQQQNPEFSDEYDRGISIGDKDSHQYESGRLPKNQYRDTNIRGNPDESALKKPVLEQYSNTSEPYSVGFYPNRMDPQGDHVESNGYSTGSPNITRILPANTHEDPTVIYYDEEQQDPPSQQMDATYANNQRLPVKSRTNKKSPPGSDVAVNRNLNGNENEPPHTSIMPKNVEYHVPDEIFGAQTFEPSAQGSEGDSKESKNNIEGDRVAKFDQARDRSSKNPASVTWVEYPSTYNEYKPPTKTVEGSQPTENSSRNGLELASHQLHASAPSLNSANEGLIGAKPKPTRSRNAASYIEKPEVPVNYGNEGVREDKPLQQLPITDGDSNITYDPGMFSQNVTPTSTKPSSPSLEPISREIDSQLQRVGNNVVENSKTVDLIHNKRPPEFGSRPLNTSSSPSNPNVDYIIPTSDQFRFNTTDVSKNPYLTDNTNPPSEMLVINSLYPSSPAVDRYSERNGTGPKNSSKINPTPVWELSLQGSSIDNHYFDEDYKNRTNSLSPKDGNGATEEFDQEFPLNENKIHPQPRASKMKTVGLIKDNKLNIPDSSQNLRRPVSEKTLDTSDIKVDTTRGDRKNLNSNDSLFQSPGQRVKEPGIPSTSMAPQQVNPNNRTSLDNRLLYGNVSEEPSNLQSVGVPSGFNDGSIIKTTNSSLMPQPVDAEISPNDDIKNMMIVIPDDLGHHPSSSTGATTSPNHGLQAAEDGYPIIDDDDPYRNTKRNPETLTRKPNESATQMDSESFLGVEIPDLDKTSDIRVHIPSSVGKVHTAEEGTDVETEGYGPFSGNREAATSGPSTKEGATIIPMFHKEGHKNGGANLTQDHQPSSQHEMGDNRMKPQSLPEFVRHHPNKMEPSSSTDSNQRYPEPTNTLFPQTEKTLDTYRKGNSTITKYQLPTDLGIINSFDRAGKDKGGYSPHKPMKVETTQSYEAPKTLQPTGGSHRGLKSEEKSETGTHAEGVVTSNLGDSSTPDKSNMNSDKIANPRNNHFPYIPTVINNSQQQYPNSDEHVAGNGLNSQNYSREILKPSNNPVSLAHNSSSEISNGVYLQDLMLTPLVASSSNLNGPRMDDEEIETANHKTEVISPNKPVISSMDGTRQDNPSVSSKPLNISGSIHDPDYDELTVYYPLLSELAKMEQTNKTSANALDKIPPENRVANNILPTDGEKTITNEFINSGFSSSPILDILGAAPLRVQKESDGVQLEPSVIDQSQEYKLKLIKRKPINHEPLNGITGLNNTVNPDQKISTNGIIALTPSGWKKVRDPTSNSNPMVARSGGKLEENIENPLKITTTPVDGKLRNDSVQQSGVSKGASNLNQSDETHKPYSIQGHILHGKNSARDTNHSVRAPTQDLGVNGEPRTVLGEIKSLIPTALNVSEQDGLHQNDDENNSPNLNNSELIVSPVLSDEPTNRSKITNGGGDAPKRTSQKQTLTRPLQTSRGSVVENSGLKAGKFTDGISSNPSHLNTSQPWSYTDFSEKKTLSQDSLNSEAYPGQRTSHNLLEQPDSKESEVVIGKFPPEVDTDPALIIKIVRNPVTGIILPTKSKLSSSIGGKSDEDDLDQNDSVPVYSRNSQLHAPVKQDKKALNPDGSKTHPYAGQPTISHKVTEQPDYVDRFEVREQSQKYTDREPIVEAKSDKSPVERINSKAAPLPSSTKIKGFSTPPERNHTMKSQPDNQTPKGQRKLDGKTGETTDAVPLDKTNSTSGTVINGDLESDPGGTNFPKGATDPLEPIDNGLSRYKLKPPARLVQYIRGNLAPPQLEPTESGEVRKQFNPATDSDPTLEGDIDQRATEGTNSESLPSVFSTKPASSIKTKVQNGPSSKKGAYSGQSTLGNENGENNNSPMKLSSKPKDKNMGRGKNYQPTENIEGSPHASSVIDGEESGVPNGETGIHLGDMNRLGPIPPSSLQSDISAGLVAIKPYPNVQIISPGQNEDKLKITPINLPNNGTVTSSKPGSKPGDTKLGMPDSPQPQRPIKGMEQNNVLIPFTPRGYPAEGNSSGDSVSGTNPPLEAPNHQYKDGLERPTTSSTPSTISTMVSSKSGSHPKKLGPKLSSSSDPLQPSSSSKTLEQDDKNVNSSRTVMYSSQKDPENMPITKTSDPRRRLRDKESSDESKLITSPSDAPLHSNVPNGKSESHPGERTSGSSHLTDLQPQGPKDMAEKDKENNSLITSIQNEKELEPTKVTAGEPVESGIRPNHVHDGRGGATEIPSSSSSQPDRFNSILLRSDEEPSVESSPNDETRDEPKLKSTSSTKLLKSEIRPTKRRPLPPQASKDPAMRDKGIHPQMRSASKNEDALNPTLVTVRKPTEIPPTLNLVVDGRRGASEMLSSSSSQPDRSNGILEQDNKTLSLEIISYPGGRQSLDEEANEQNLKPTLSSKSLLTSTVPNGKSGNRQGETTLEYPSSLGNNLQVPKSYGRRGETNRIDHPSSSRQPERSINNAASSTEALPYPGQGELVEEANEESKLKSQPLEGTGLDGKSGSRPEDTSHPYSSASEGLQPQGSIDMPKTGKVLYPLPTPTKKDYELMPSLEKVGESIERGIVPNSKNDGHSEGIEVLSPLSSALPKKSIEELKSDKEKDDDSDQRVKDHETGEQTKLKLKPTADGILPKSESRTRPVKTISKYSSFPSDLLPGRDMAVTGITGNSPTRSTSKYDDGVKLQSVLLSTPENSDRSDSISRLQPFLESSLRSGGTLDDKKDGEGSKAQSTPSADSTVPNGKSGSYPEKAHQKDPRPSSNLPPESSIDQIKIGESIETSKMPIGQIDGEEKLSVVPTTEPGMNDLSHNQQFSHLYSPLEVLSYSGQRPLEEGTSDELKIKSIPSGELPGSIVLNGKSGTRPVDATQKSSALESVRPEGTRDMKNLDQGINPSMRSTSQDVDELKLPMVPSIKQKNSGSVPNLEYDGHRETITPSSSSMVQPGLDELEQDDKAPSHTGHRVLDGDTGEQPKPASTGMSISKSNDPLLKNTSSLGRLQPKSSIDVVTTDHGMNPFIGSSTESENNDLAPNSGSGRPDGAGRSAPSSSSVVQPGLDELEQDDKAPSHTGHRVLDGDTSEQPKPASIGMSIEPHSKSKDPLLKNSSSLGRLQPKSSIDVAKTDHDTNPVTRSSSESGNNDLAPNSGSGRPDGAGRSAASSSSVVQPGLDELEQDDEAPSHIGHGVLDGDTGEQPKPASIGMSIEPSSKSKDPLLKNSSSLGRLQPNSSIDVAKTDHDTNPVTGSSSESGNNDLAPNSGSGRPDGAGRSAAASSSSVVPPGLDELEQDDKAPSHSGHRVLDGDTGEQPKPASIGLSIEPHSKSKDPLHKNSSSFGRLQPKSSIDVVKADHDTNPVTGSSAESGNNDLAPNSGSGRPEGAGRSAAASSSSVVQPGLDELEQDKKAPSHIDHTVLDGDTGEEPKPSSTGISTEPNSKSKDPMLMNYSSLGHLQPKSSIDVVETDHGMNPFMRTSSESGNNDLAANSGSSRPEGAGRRAASSSSVVQPGLDELEQDDKAPSHTGHRVLDGDTGEQPKPASIGMSIEPHSKSKDPLLKNSSSLGRLQPKSSTDVAKTDHDTNPVTRSSSESGNNDLAPNSGSGRPEGAGRSAAASSSSVVQPGLDELEQDDKAPSHSGHRVLDGDTGEQPKPASIGMSIEPHSKSKDPLHKNSSSLGRLQPKSPIDVVKTDHDTNPVTGSSAESGNNDLAPNSGSGRPEGAGRSAAASSSSVVQPGLDELEQDKKAPSHIDHTVLDGDTGEEPKPSSTGISTEPNSKSKDPMLMNYSSLGHLQPKSSIDVVETDHGMNPFMRTSSESGNNDLAPNTGSGRPEGAGRSAASSSSVVQPGLDELEQHDKAPSHTGHRVLDGDTGEQPKPASIGMSIEPHSKSKDPLLKNSSSLGRLQPKSSTDVAKTDHDTNPVTRSSSESGNNDLAPNSGSGRPDGAGRSAASSSSVVQPGLDELEQDDKAPSHSGHRVLDGDTGEQPKPTPAGMSTEPNSKSKDPMPKNYSSLGPLQPKSSIDVVKTDHGMNPFIGSSTESENNDLAPNSGSGRPEGASRRVASSSSVVQPGLDELEQDNKAQSHKGHTVLDGDTGEEPKPSSTGISTEPNSKSKDPLLKNSSSLGPLQPKSSIDVVTTDHGMNPVTGSSSESGNNDLAPNSGSGRPEGAGRSAAASSSSVVQPGLDELEQDNKAPSHTDHTVLDGDTGEKPKPSSTGISTEPNSKSKDPMPKNSSSLGPLQPKSSIDVVKTNHGMNPFIGSSVESGNNDLAPNRGSGHPEGAGRSAASSSSVVQPGLDELEQDDKAPSHTGHRVLDGDTGEQPKPASIGMSIEPHSKSKDPLLKNSSSLGRLQPKSSIDVAKTDHDTNPVTRSSSESGNNDLAPNSGSGRPEGAGRSAASSSSVVQPGKSQHDDPLDTETTRNPPITLPNQDVRQQGPQSVSNAQNHIIQPSLQTNAKASSPTIPNSYNIDEQDRPVFSSPSASFNRYRHTLGESPNLPISLPSQNKNKFNSPSSTFVDAEGPDYQNAIRTLPNINSGNYTLFTADYFLQLIEHCHCQSLKFLIPILRRPNSGILVTS